MIVEFVAQGGRPEDWRPVFSIAPTDEAPIVRERKDEVVERQLVLASWGLKPSWAKEKGLAPINARLETAATNGMFRKAFAQHRCLVPMNGYYEWEATETGKQPHFLHRGNETLAAAGLYAARKVEENWQLSFTIITRTARDAAGEVHERMPVFVGDDYRDAWLSPDEIDVTEATTMLDYTSKEIAKDITSYPVDRKVNSVRKVDPADPTLIDPIEL